MNRHSYAFHHRSPSHFQLGTCFSQNHCFGHNFIRNTKIHPTSTPDTRKNTRFCIVQYCDGILASIQTGHPIFTALRRSFRYFVHIYFLNHFIMKKLISFCLVISTLLFSVNTMAQQDKSKRPSPPATVKQTIASGATVSINYSQPSVKGRTIGKDLEPMDGQVWRTGANEATVLETDKPLTINGKTLPAGKYALFSISGKESWTIIFNKKWEQWGAYEYKEADDALRISVTPQKAETFSETLTFVIDMNGGISFRWGNYKIRFTVI
jgi:hypothetical protein